MRGMMKKKSLAYGMLAVLLTGVLAVPMRSYGTEAAGKEAVAETEESSGLIAGEDEKAPAQKVGTEGMIPVYGKDVADGTYAVEVESSSSMFRIVKAELTVSDGEMSAVITLGGKGYLKLFMGTGEEAVAADESAYANYAEDAQGAYTYEIAVEALNKELECTGFSKRKEKWYDHQICFDAASLPGEALLIELPAEHTETADIGSEHAENAESPAEPQRIEQSEIDLEDGTYRIDLDFSGGSGKASVESPAIMKVEDKKATAVIVWSSPNYDYMLVNGEKYLPVNKEGNSTFEIPLLLFDQEMPVLADTVAMGTPHEVAYALTFHADSVKPEEVSGTSAGAVLLTAAAAFGIAALAAVFLLPALRKRKKDREESRKKR